MKKQIHPQYYEKAIITCSCGAVLETGSTQKKLQIEICSQCHPFYTGKKKIVDNTGRVDRFKKISEKTTDKKESIKKAKIEKKKKETKSKDKKKAGKKKNNLMPI